MSFLFNLIGNVLLDRFFLLWARGKTDTQIDEMQRSAFDTPGFQSPLPVSVLAAGGVLLAGQIGLGRGVWKLSGRQAWLGLLLGAVISIALQLLQRGLQEQ